MPREISPPKTRHNWRGSGSAWESTSDDIRDFGISNKEDESKLKLTCDSRI